MSKFTPSKGNDFVVEYSCYIVIFLNVSSNNKPCYGTWLEWHKWCIDSVELSINSLHTTNSKININSEHVYMMIRVLNT